MIRQRLPLARLGRLPFVVPPKRELTASQLDWLRRGLTQAGGKLPLFDDTGRRIHSNTIRSCLDAGWAERWFHNPLKPDWEVCRLTEAGRAVLARVNVVRVDFAALRVWRRRDRRTTISEIPSLEPGRPDTA